MLQEHAFHIEVMMAETLEAELWPCYLQFLRVSDVCNRHLKEVLTSLQNNHGRY